MRNIRAYTLSDTISPLYHAMSDTSTCPYDLVLNADHPYSPTLLSSELCFPFYTQRYKIPVNY